MVPTGRDFLRAYLSKNFDEARKLFETDMARHVEERLEETRKRIAGTLLYDLTESKHYKPVIEYMGKEGIDHCYLGHDKHGETKEFRHVDRKEAEKQARKHAFARVSPLHEHTGGGHLPNPKPQVDMTNKKCTQCKKGTYGETGIQDDMHGVLHCSKCSHETKRWQ